MDSLSKLQSPKILTSLALGLPIPILYGVYSVLLDVMSKRGSHTEISKNIATLQMSWFAIALTVLAGLAITAFRSEFRISSIGLLLRHHWRNLLMVNICTLLGPPLYIFAVVRLGAGAANWIDLGMVPLLTFVMAFWSDDGNKGLNIYAYLGALLASFGLLVVMFELGSKSNEGSMVGVIASVLSALGTAGAGIFIRRVQKDSQLPVPDELLLSIRFLMALFVLTIGMFVMKGAMSTLAFDYRLDKFLLLLVFFYVLPSYVYVLIVREKGLMYSGYMWALLPVCASAIELIIVKKPSLQLSTTILTALLILIGVVLSEFKTSPDRSDDSEPSPGVG